MTVSAGGGVYCVARAVWEDPEFPEEPFSEREAWLWFVGQAMWREGKVKTFAGTLHLDRGELCYSERFLAEKWKWSKSRVNRVLDRWELRGWIDGVTVNQKRGSQRGNERGSQHRTVSVYSIRNYNKNQMGSPAEESGSGAVNGAGVFKKRGKEEEVRTEKIKAAGSEPPSAAQEPSQKLWKEGLTTLASLANPFLGEAKARTLIGRWLSRKNGQAASADDVLRAIRAAAAAGTLDPVPYIQATLKASAASAVRRDGDCWLIPHGTEEYTAYRKRATLDNSPELYKFPDTPGHVARVKSRWPVANYADFAGSVSR